MTANTTVVDSIVKKILILSANPKNTSELRLGEEVREIQTGLDRAKKREQFEIITKWAVRIEDLRRALLDYEPQIVHFSGHGSGSDGLVLEKNLGELQLVSTKSLAGLFNLFKDTVECVLLNACYSEDQAEAIHQNIGCVIGMRKAVGDRAAIKFAVGFYDAIGAGRSYENAFEFGCTSIDLEGIPESETPIFKSKNRDKIPINSISKLPKSISHNPCPEDSNPNDGFEEYNRDFNYLFYNLKFLLECEDWEKANEETHSLILKINNKNKKHQWQLDKATIKKFSCTHLNFIDKLWVDSSKGKKFGFTSQEEIYNKICSNHLGVFNYNLFCKCVGWNSRKNRSFYRKYEIPLGHFPKPPHLFNLENTLKVCFFIIPLVISLIVYIFLLKLDLYVIPLALTIGFLVGLLSFIIHTSSYLEGFEWTTSLKSKLEECEKETKHVSRSLRT